MTELQQRMQCDGPHRPLSRDFACAIIKFIPSHYEVRAVSIKGQAGGIFVECYYEGSETTFHFDEYGRQVESGQ